MGLITSDNNDTKKSHRDRERASITPKQCYVLNDSDLRTLSLETGLMTIEILRAFQKFSEKNQNGFLTKDKFKELYRQFKSMNLDKVDDLSGRVFDLMDTNNDGFLSFQEFIVFAFSFILKLEC
jgi:Ca2+-binding EF-hand superfamily protein